MILDEKKSEKKNIRIKVLNVLMDNKRFGFNEVQDLLKNEYDVCGSPETLSFHLDDLKNNKFVDKEEGKFGKWFITPLGVDECRKLKQVEEFEIVSISRKDIKWRGLVIENKNKLGTNFTASANASLSEDLEREYKEHMFNLAQQHAEWLKDKGLPPSSSCSFVVGSKSLQNKEVASLEDKK